MRQTGWSGFFSTLRWWVVGFVFLANFAVWNASAGSAASALAFPVEAGDQLQVVVYGEENVSSILSGRFRVESDGSINYPLLGRPEVEGLSPTEIADLLENSLSEWVRVSRPTVTVAEYAPVFLIGDVTRTGPFQFQPDMTVFQLVLLAGGTSRAGASEEAKLSVLQELAALKLNNFSLRVQKARLMAEIEGVAFDGGAFSDEAAELDAASIVSAEAAIYKARQNARMSRRRTHDQQVHGYDQEISSIERAIVLHDEEVRLLEEQLEVQSGLAERGLAAQSVRRDAQRQLTASRREALEFRTALFQAKQNRIAAGQALNEAEIRLEEENVKALREVELAISQNTISLGSAKAKFAQFEATENAAQNALGRIPRYRITRVVDGEHTSRLVDAFAKLERGDIVTVSFTANATIQATPEPSRQSQATQQ